jgi:hypothetical protein
MEGPYYVKRSNLAPLPPPPIQSPFLKDTEAHSTVRVGENPGLKKTSPVGFFGVLFGSFGFFKTTYFSQKYLNL